MATYEIWHNPRCTKSRQTLARLEAAGVTVKEVLYLEDPPSAARIKTVLGLLGFDDPRQLMRTKEAEYKAQGLKDVTAKGKLIEAMVKTPKLIERPVVIKDGKRAVLGRPPENVDDLL